MPNDGAGAEWRGNWPVVLAACLGVAAASTHSYSMGLFIEPLQREFGWSRAQISSGPAMTAVAAVLFTPFVGAMVDRIGPRWIAIGGTAAVLGLTCLLPLVGPGIATWYAMWVLLALLTPLVLPNIWATPVAGLFDKGRGLALGLTLAGSGLSSIVTPLLCFWLIDRFGWRTGFVGLAGFWAALALPLALAFLFGPRDQPQVAQAEVARPPASDWRGTLMTRRFAMLAAAALLFAAVVPAMVINLVPVLTWSGLPRGEAAGVASLVGVTAIVGRLVIGTLLDRFPARHLALVVTGLPVIACALLLSAHGSLPLATAAALMLGFSLGAEYDIVAYMASRYFPVGSFGLTFGTLAGVIAFAGLSGPMWTNAIYDATGSYQAALQVAMPLCPVAALLFFLLGPYPGQPVPVPPAGPVARAATE